VLVGTVGAKSFGSRDSHACLLPTPEGEGTVDDLRFLSAPCSSIGGPDTIDRHRSNKKLSKREREDIQSRHVATRKGGSLTGIRYPRTIHPVDLSHAEYKLASRSKRFRLRGGQRSSLRCDPSSTRRLCKPASVGDCHHVVWKGCQFAENVGDNRLRRCDGEETEIGAQHDFLMRARGNGGACSGQR
jgi:hypothetical protein